MKLSRLAPVALVLGVLCLVPAGAYGQHRRLFGPRCSNSYSRPVQIVPSMTYSSGCPTGNCDPAGPVVGSYPSNPYGGVSYPAYPAVGSYPSGPAPRQGVFGRMLEGSGSR
jgi:hypothetical protein